MLVNKPAVSCKSFDRTAYKNGWQIISYTFHSSNNERNIFNNCYIIRKWEPTDKRAACFYNYHNGIAFLTAVVKLFIEVCHVKRLDSVDGGETSALSEFYQHCKVVCYQYHMFHSVYWMQKLKMFVGLLFVRELTPRLWDGCWLPLTHLSSKDMDLR